MNVDNVGGPNHTQNQAPVTDTRRQGPAQASEAESRSRGRDVLELHSNSPKGNSPVESREESHKASSAKLENLSEKLDESKTQKAEAEKKERASEQVHDRIKLDREKTRAELSGNEQQIKEAEREILLSQGEKNIDLLA